MTVSRSKSADSPSLPSKHFENASTTTENVACVEASSFQNVRRLWMTNQGKNYGMKQGFLLQLPLFN